MPQPKSRFQNLKDVLKDYGQKATESINESIDLPSGDTLRPTDTAAGYGLPAAMDINAAIETPSEEEIEETKGRFNKTLAKYNLPQSDMPPPIPMIPGIIKSSIRESNLHPYLNIKPGMTEDAALKQVLDFGPRGSSNAAGAGLIDKYGNELEDIAKGELVRHVREGNPVKVQQFKFLMPDDYPILEKKMGVTPGTSAGFYNPQHKVVGLNLGSGIEPELASTLSHEIQHAVDVGKVTPEQWAKIPNQSTNIKKMDLRGPEDYQSLYNELIDKGQFQNALELENASKASHHLDNRNFEMESFLDNILRNHSENIRPEDVEMIRQNFPERFEKIFGRK